MRAAKHNYNSRLPSLSVVGPFPFSRACESKLQMLRHIRQRIVKLETEKEEVGLHTTAFAFPLHHQKESANNNVDEEIGDTSSSDFSNSVNETKDENSFYITSNRNSLLIDKFGKSNNQPSTSTSISVEEESIERVFNAHSIEFSSKTETTSKDQQIDKSRFSYEHFDVMEYAKKIGFREEAENMTEFIDGTYFMIYYCPV